MALEIEYADSASGDEKARVFITNGVTVIFA